MYRKLSGPCIAVVIVAVFMSPMIATAKDDTVCDSLSGAIFTTDSDGNLVNGNIYYDKEDVYLNGGPRANAPDHAAALPDGSYYFQVTDPSGKVLLSLDPLDDRVIEVEDGVFELVQLAPFEDTPNEGGEYKVWVTSVDCYDDEPDAAGTNFGFREKYSKTDNFKVVSGVRRRLVVRKFKDCNANGVWDEDESEIEGWEVSITEPGGHASQVRTTPVTTGVYAGNWTVSEIIPSHACSDWMQTALIVDGQSMPVADTVVVPFGESDTDADEEIHEVIFGNIPLGSISVFKFYDYNVNGIWDNCEPPVPGVKFVLVGRDIFGDPAGLLDVHRTSYTSADGWSTFCGLLPGVYTLREILPDNTPSCNWRTTTPTQVQDFIVTCNSPAYTTHWFGNVTTAVADFRHTSYWHKEGLANISRCLDAEGDLREQLALQVLEFVFNVWQILGGPTLIEMPDGTWLSTSDIIGEAVAAANSLEAGAPEERKRLISLLEEINDSEAIVYIVQDFSLCLPTEEY